MNDGVVVEVGFDARGIFVMARYWEMRVAHFGDEDAWAYLQAVADVVPEHLPVYVLERVRFWREQGIPTK